MQYGWEAHWGGNNKTVESKISRTHTLIIVPRKRLKQWKEQRTKSNMENIKKELQKMKQEKETRNHEIETLRKLNKIQIQAVPDKEKEIRRLTTIIEKEKE